LLNMFVKGFELGFCTDYIKTLFFFFLKNN
jgi:hypothetical protein